MVAPEQTGIGSMPSEIRDQIIRCIPLADMPNVILSSRAFHKHANAQLYRSVYHFIGSTQPDRYKFPLIRSPTVAHYPECSAQIDRLPQFLRTITECPELLSFIDEASFSVSGNADEVEVEVLRRCLSLLSPSTLHLALSNNNADLALASGVTSLDIEYPAEEDLEDLQDSIRDHVYSIFSIPSLRHLSLRSARCWNAFSPIMDSTRARTSNVVSLFLPDTVPMDSDLKEILTWPKELQSIYHQSEVRDDGFFYTVYGGEMRAVASPELFLQGISSQKASLEDVSYNNEKDCGGDDESSFTPALMSEFTNLRTLSVPWSCLMDEYTEMHPLFRVLPPNLEELYLNYGIKIGDLQAEAKLSKWLREVVDHKKECIPSLKTIVLWQWQRNSHNIDYHGLANALVKRLYVFFISSKPQLFKSHFADIIIHLNLIVNTNGMHSSLVPALKTADLQLEFILRPSTGTWDSNMWR